MLGIKNDMKNLSLLIIILVFISCSAQEESKVNEIKTSSELSVSDNVIDSFDFPLNLNAFEFKDGFDPQNAILLDVRTPQETGLSFIEGASFINLYDEAFVSKINSMDKSKAVYVYCKGGSRSSKAANLLVENGFAEVYNLKGGIISWENSNYKVIKGNGTFESVEKKWSLSEFSEFIVDNQLVLIQYKTEWCAPCKRMNPVIDSIDSSHTNMLVEKVDFDANKELMQDQTIKSVPTIVLYYNGEEVWREIGFIDYQELETILLSWTK